MADNNERGRRKRPWRKAQQRSEDDGHAMKSDDGVSTAKRPHIVPSTAFSHSQSQSLSLSVVAGADGMRSVTQRQLRSSTRNSIDAFPGPSGLTGTHIYQCSTLCYDLELPKRPRITASPDPVPPKRLRITAPPVSLNNGEKSNRKGRKGKEANRDNEYSFMESPSALMFSPGGEGSVGKRGGRMEKRGRGVGGRGQGGRRGGGRGGREGMEGNIRRENSSRKNLIVNEDANKDYNFCNPEDVKRLLGVAVGHQVSQLLRNPSFGYFLHKSSIEPTSLSLIVQLLSGTACCEIETLQRQIVRCVIPKLFEADSQGFLNSLRHYLCSLPMTANFSVRVSSVSFLGNLHKLFKVILASENTSIPALTKLPVDALWGATRQLTDQEIRFQDLHEKAKQLLEMRDGIRMTLYETSEQRAYKNDHTVLPTRDELEQKTLPLALQKNIVHGPYPSAAEYLSIQYHLLREDFIHPLRCALHRIETDEEESLDVKVYHNVHFQECVFSLYEGSAFEITFEAQGHSQIKWDRSKRFTFGSLLCLMDDNFSTILFATVAERDVDKLREGILVIKLETEVDGLALSPKTAYRMIESPGFYAAYAPVLRHLHEADPKKLPFSKYVVKCETEIDLPAYMKDKEEFKLNLVHLKGDENGDYSAVNVLDRCAWSDVSMPTLDDSQKEALYSALTKELAVIQGPPGTGKTYIGLKIVETLLRNRNRWDSGTAVVGAPKSPIVVVCYTNHALDQFLEGIIRLKGHSIDQNTQIRRVGGRSKSELVNEYNIRHYVKKSLHEQRIFGFWKKKNYQLRQRINALEDLLNHEYDKKKLKLYASFMGPDIDPFLKRYCNIHCDDSIDLATWLDPHRFQFVHKRVTFYSHHQTIEDDRKFVSADFEEDSVTELFEHFEKNVLEEFFMHFAEVKPLSQAQAEEMEKSPRIDGLESFCKQKVFKYCLQMLKPELEKQLEMGSQGEKEYEQQKQMTMIRCLQRADVIGLTTTGAAKHNPILSKIEAKVVIIEEAAEVLEAHVISTLTQSTEHMILIGDHQQLRPKTNEYILARDYHLDISLFERLIRNKFPCVTLQVQHRMRPEISAIVSSNIYGNSLIDAPSTENYPAVVGMKCNMFFVHHEVREAPNIDLKSPLNDHEATFLARLCRYLLQQGYSEEKVTVITPYTGQMYNLRDKFLGYGMSNIKITPIDSYQGEENDIILLSLVRSEKPGFVKDENRICVALSRAKHGLYVIGNFTLFCASSKLWHSVVQDLHTQDKIGQNLPLECQRHQTITEVATTGDFDRVCDGGCSLPCNYRLPCNHMCPYRCHPDDEKHRDRCMEPCPKYCQEGHRCKKLCHEPCGRCRELVEKIMPECGHIQRVPCYQNPEDFKCQEPCSEVLPCGHKCKRKCGEEHTTECCELITREWPCKHRGQAECYWTEEMYSRRCKVPCDVTLLCGHPCQGTCGECRQGRLHKPCKEKCNRTLTCGHQCKSNCAQNCPSCNQKCKFQCPHGPCGHKCHELCRPCAHKCEVKCEHQQCTRNCGEQCDIEPCDEPCLKKLPCNHPCMGICGETCPDVCRICDKENFNEKVPIIFGTEDLDDNPELRIIQLDCGHKFEVKSMDQWMQEDTEGKIQWKACFLCKVPIFKTQRYIKIIKEIKDDLNEVKKKELTMTTTHERENLQRTLTDMARHSRILRCQKQFITSISKISDKRLYAEYSILAAERSVRKAIEHEEEEMDTGYLTQQQTERKELWIAIKCLKTQYQDFIRKLEYYRLQSSITDQILRDVEAEKNRICLLSAVYQVELQIMRAKVKLSDDDMQHLKTLRSKYETKGNQVCTLCVAEYNSSMSYIEDLKKKYRLGGIAPWEKQMILKAMHARQGSWYKCRNGHIYNIGECGGAMVTSRCPECGATIGGRNHQLHSDNAHAGEFDDSRHAAWSEMANLQNFDPQDLL